jgi:maltose/moltooligosaccharide transporter
MANSGLPRLSTLRVLQMNLGFLGLQFSFGLQQSNMGPIYGFLGADKETMPLLWLAGPVTGLIVQPIVGAMSDRTNSRLGRRTPYFLVGAVLCSVSLFLMPLSAALWMAVSLLWILDAANNITMEPYRAYVADRMAPPQRPLGFLTQASFTGLAQTLSYLTPSLLVWWGFNRDALGDNGIPETTRIAFLVGSVLSIITILYSIWRVPELPLSDAQRAALAERPLSVKGTFAELADAVRDMPPVMRQLAWPMLFQWYAMFCYWQYVVFALAERLHGDVTPDSAAFRETVLLNGQLGGLYNFIAFAAAFAMVPFTRRIGARPVHAFAVACSGVAMIGLAQAQSLPLMFMAMLGIGLGWASLMGNPYVMLASAIPPERNGVYMGIFNMFIVIPMLIQTLTLPLIYGPLLGGSPANVLMLAGFMMLMAAATTLAVKAGAPRQSG